MAELVRQDEKGCKVESIPMLLMLMMRRKRRRRRRKRRKGWVALQRFSGFRQGGRNKRRMSRFRVAIESLAGRGSGVAFGVGAPGHAS